MAQHMSTEALAEIAKHEPTASYLYQLVSTQLGRSALAEIITQRKDNKSYDAIAAYLSEQTGIQVSREGCRRWARLYNQAQRNTATTIAPAETA